MVAASNRPDSIDASLRRPGRFGREIEIGVPDPAERERILRAHLAGMRHELRSDETLLVPFLSPHLNHSLCPLSPLLHTFRPSLTPTAPPRLPRSDNDIRTAASRAHGFVGADIAALASEAAMAALRRVVALQKSGPPEVEIEGVDTAEGAGPRQRTAESAGSVTIRAPLGYTLAVTPADLAAAETRVRPSALKEFALEVPKVSWSDVGGLGPVKGSLREAVEWPIRHAEALSRMGAQAPLGVLLYGPPGCSKTLLARAVASEAEMNFMSVKGPELFSKYVGGEC